MVDRAAYDATHLDMARLRGYAKKVARECRKPPSPEERDTQGRVYVDRHWVLHQTDHSIDKYRSNGTREEQYWEFRYWVLLADGRLRCYSQTFEQVGRNPRFDEHYGREMTESDIERLDFKDRRRQTGQEGRGTYTYGNREPGALVRHAKGVGLSLALKGLLG